jgi:hypothetical protein
MAITLDGTTGITTPGVVNSGSETIGGTLGVTGAVTLSTTLGVAQGGTGATALTSGSVLIGAGTSAVSLVAAGTSGNVLKSNGTTWTSSADAGGFSNMTVYTSPGTFTTPSTTTQIKVTVVGGGGGGTDGTYFPAFPSPTQYPGGGGGGGGSAIYVGAVTASTPYAVTVGTAGVNGPNGSPNPYVSPNATAGNTSSFGALVSATGGSGGTYGNAGGPGGGGTGGTLNLTGVRGYKAPVESPFSTTPAIGGGSGLGVSYGQGGGQDAPFAGVVIVEY